MEGIFSAHVARNEFAARGTRWLTLRLDGDEPVAVAPGNIVSVILRDGTRRPYTVSRARGEAREIDLLMRTIVGGKVSPLLSELPVGAPLTVQGTWGRPLREVVHPEARTFIGISTGTGIGPLIGVSAELWMPVTLVAGFRSSADICVDELPRGVRLHLTLTEPSRSWVGLRGRSHVSAPSLLDDLVGAHVHLVGNGAMIAIWTEALRRAGIPLAGLTSETYFNASPPADEEAISRLSHTLGRLYRGEGRPPRS